MYMLMCYYKVSSFEIFVVFVVVYILFINSVLGSEVSPLCVSMKPLSSGSEVLYFSITNGMVYC